MVKSHKKLLCEGRCVVSDPRYYDELMTTARLLAVQTNRQLLPGGRGSIANAVDLVDPDLHGYVCVCRLPQLETLRDVLGGLKTVLLQMTPGDTVRRFEPKTEVLLRCAVATADAQLLFDNLTKLRENGVLVPTCLLASLLRQAINSFFDKGVEILLENGASPSYGLFAEDYDRPMSRATSLFVYHDFAADNNNELNNNAALNFVVASKEERLTKIIASLIRHGADLLAGTLDESKSGIALHRVAWIAMRSPTAARMIIEATPVAGLKNCHGVLMAFDRPMYSSMSVSLHVAALLYQTAAVRRDAAKILPVAVLPLLRAGAAAGPDLLGEGEFLQVYSTFMRSSADDDLESFRNWRRKEIATEFLLETRQKASLNVERLVAIQQSHARERRRGGGELDWEANNNTTETEQPNNEVTVTDDQAQTPLSQFVALIRAQFPRPLQAVCRTSILRTLPSGVTARPAAVNTLILPSFLIDFLKFNELEPCNSQQ